MYSVWLHTVVVCSAHLQTVFQRVLVHILKFFLYTYLQGSITSYFFNLSSVGSEKINASHMVSFRVAAQNAFLISNFSDASHVTLTSGTIKLVSTCACAWLMHCVKHISVNVHFLNHAAPPVEKGGLNENVDSSMILPAVFVPVVALLIIILLTVLVISFVMWRLHRNSIKLV